MVSVNDGGCAEERSTPNWMSSSTVLVLAVSSVAKCERSATPSVPTPPPGAPPPARLSRFSETGGRVGEMAAKVLRSGTSAPSLTSDALTPQTSRGPAAPATRKRDTGRRGVGDGDSPSGVVAAAKISIGAQSGASTAAVPRAHLLPAAAAREARCRGVHLTASASPQRRFRKQQGLAMSNRGHAVGQRRGPCASAMRVFRVASRQCVTRSARRGSQGYSAKSPRGCLDSSDHPRLQSIWSTSIVSARDNRP